MCFDIFQQIIFLKLSPLPALQKKKRKKEQFLQKGIEQSRRGLI